MPDLGKLVLGSMLLVGLAQAGTVIDHERMWTLPRLAGPVVSPDGTRVAIQLTQASLDGPDVADLWLMDARVGGGRRLTFHPAAEAQPAWSPDGQLLAFVSQREGDDAPQVYLLDLANGGEARRLTQQLGGARTPAFSPDGRFILFQSVVHAGTNGDEQDRRRAAEIAARPEQVRTYEGFPIRRWNRWLDERQTRLFQVPVDGGPATDLLAETPLVQADGYGPRLELSSGTLDPVYSPDGRFVLFVASQNANEAAYGFTHTELWSLELDGLQLRQISGLGGRGDSHATPRFGDRGKRLYVQVRPRGDKVYNAAHVDQYSWPEGRFERRLSAPEGRSIDDFEADPNGSDVWYLTERAGHVDLHTLGARSAIGRPVLELERGVLGQLSVSAGRERTLVAVYQSSTEPPELVRIDVANGRTQPLTQVAVAAAAELDLAEPIHFWFDNDQGMPIHSMLIRPPDFDPQRRYPLLVLMHGGPHSMWRDHFFLRWNYHLLAAPGYVVLLTNYRESTGFGEAFAQSIQGDPFAGPAADIQQAAEVAIERFPYIDGSRQCAGGASYGGHLANWLQGTTDRYRCLISHAGLVNLEAQWGTSDIIYGREVTAGGPVWEQGSVWTEQNPARLAANFRTPVLVSVGERDYRVPMNNVLEYWSLLQRQQVPSRLLVYPTEDHWIQNAHNSRHYYGEVHGWLARWLEDSH
ncbi:MAG: S9 family peptidase [Xanthomonadales bacterium]|nr:S9 family peptidase [Xanthomonadales bacterium]